MLTTDAVKERTTTRFKPVALYLLIAFGLAWLCWLPVLLGPSGLHLTRYDASIPVFVSLGTVGPLIASFIATRYETGRWAMPSRFLPARHWRRWLCLVIGPALTIVAFVVIPYMICVAPGHKLIPIGFLAPLAAVWPNILGGPLEEEFGWRGYLLPRLSPRMGSTWATLLIGVIWASWHLPMFLAHVWGISFWYYVPIVVAQAVFASLAYFTTGNSILAPILVHYTFNTANGMINMALNGKPVYGNRDLSEIILASMVCVAVLTIVFTRGRLGSR
jgi:uncharacterized protein